MTKSITMSFLLFRLYHLHCTILKCHHVVNDVTFYTMLLPRSKCKAVVGSWTCRLWINWERCLWEAPSEQLGCVVRSQAHPSAAEQSLKTHSGNSDQTSRCHPYTTEVPQRHQQNYSGLCAIWFSAAVFFFYKMLAYNDIRVKLN